MEFRSLPVKLSDAELKECAERLAAAINEQTEIEIERKAEADKFKEKVRECAGVIQSFARMIRTGDEYRSIGCEWKRDGERWQMLLIREDTGEVLQTREMRDDERQTDLFLLPSVDA